MDFKGTALVIGASGVISFFLSSEEISNYFEDPISSNLSETSQIIEDNNDISFQKEEEETAFITNIVLACGILLFYTCLISVNYIVKFLRRRKPLLSSEEELPLVVQVKANDELVLKEVVQPSTEHILESKQNLHSSPMVIQKENAGVEISSNHKQTSQDVDFMKILKEIYTASSERLFKINNKDLTFMDNNDTVMNSFTNTANGMDTPMQLLKQIMIMIQQGDKTMTEAWAEYVDNATAAFEKMEKEYKTLKLQTQRDNFLMQSQFEKIVSDMEQKLSQATNQAVSASSKAKEMVEEVTKLRMKEKETIQHKMDLDKQIQEAVQKHEKAKREVKFEVSYARPSYWGNSTNDDYKQIPVDEKSDEFAFVYDLMNSTLRKHQSGVGLVNGVDPATFQITNLYRVHNLALWKKYCHQKQCIKEIQKDILPSRPFSKYLKKNKMLTPLLDPSVNEYWLFHGTSWKVIQILAQTGYDTRVSSISGLFGCGFYLAENSSKSNQYVPCPGCERNSVFNDGRCICKNNEDLIYGMVLYRALLGNGHMATEWNTHTYKGSNNNPVRRPPLTDDGITTYDCVVGESKLRGGNRLEFREIILYDNNLAYPEYIICFKRSPQQQPAQTDLKDKANKFLSAVMASNH